MANNEPFGRMSLDAFLAWEELQPDRYEYVAGEAHVKEATTGRHSLIVLNIASALRPLARRRGCRVFADTVFVRASDDRLYYPDVLAACGAAAEVEKIVDAPSLVVEVTSPSTRATDRREKLEAYKQIPSLGAYLIVDQRRRLVLAYTRDDVVGWVREEIQSSGEIALRFLGGSITLDEIYDDVPLPPLKVGEPLGWPEWAEW